MSVDREHTSRELSQRLKDKGFRGEHKSVWVSHPNVFGGKPFVITVNHYHDNPDKDLIVLCPAWTFNELWGVLPEWIKETWSLILLKEHSDGKTVAGYESRVNLMQHSFRHESPTEAVGLLLEWLIDEGHCDTNGGNDER
jgi:hypothetical protein